MDAQPTPWYQVIAGILAIPVAIVTFFYSVFLIKKGQLESRKLELEIREKEQQLGEHSPLQPITMPQEVQNFILRFIAFISLASLWVVGTYLASSTADVIGHSYTLGGRSAAAMIISLIVATVFKYCLFVTVLAFSMSLFRDINKYLGIKPIKLLLPFSNRKDAVGRRPSDNTEPKPPTIKESTDND